MCQKPFGDRIMFRRWFDEKFARAKNQTDTIIGFRQHDHLFKAVGMQQIVLEKEFYVLG